MILILEIILTIVAWKRGWKWLSLLPIGIGLLIGFLIGMGMANSSGSEISTVGLILDLIIVAILAVMCIVKKNPKESENKLN